MPTTYAGRLACRLRRAARDGCELSEDQARLMRAAADLVLIQAAILAQKVKQARILSRRLAVAREDKHQLRRTVCHLRRRVARPGVVTEEAFTGYWPN